MFIVHVHCSLFMFIVHCSHGATLIFDDLYSYPFILLHFSFVSSGSVHRESKVPKWELGGRIFQLNFNIFFENISDNGT